MFSQLVCVFRSRTTSLNWNGGGPVQTRKSWILVSGRSTNSAYWQFSQKTLGEESATDSDWFVEPAVGFESWSDVRSAGTYEDEEDQSAGA
jgi:hypothetical protein